MYNIQYDKKTDWNSMIEKIGFKSLCSNNSYNTSTYKSTFLSGDYVNCLNLLDYIKKSAINACGAVFRVVEHIMRLYP